MTTSSFKLITCTALGLANVDAAAHDGPAIDAFILAGGLVSQLQAPSPFANIWYRGTWDWSPADDAPRADAKDVRVQKGRVSYCVLSEIRITPRETRPSAPMWERSFNLELVNSAGEPAAPVFRAVVVPTPIPVNTTRKLEPTPKWCATVPGVQAPPKLFLKVGDNKVLVEFTTLPNTHPHKHPPGSP
jgi:hypothetical protein